MAPARIEIRPLYTQDYRQPSASGRRYCAFRIVRQGPDYPVRAGDIFHVDRRAQDGKNAPEFRARMTGGESESGCIQKVAPAEHAPIISGRDSGPRQGFYFHCVRSTKMSGTRVSIP